MAPIEAVGSTRASRATIADESMPGDGAPPDETV